MTYHTTSAAVRYLPAAAVLLAMLLFWNGAFSDGDGREDSLVTAEGSGDRAHSAGGHDDPIAPTLLALIVILGGAKVGGELFERINQPAVLGELVAGVIMGNIVLLNPAWSFLEPLRVETPEVSWAVVVDSFARIGVILLLFEVGLESSVGEMRKVGWSSLLVALVGVVAPFAFGYGVSALMIQDVPAALREINPDFDIRNIHLFIGATLTATSVGITARVLKDLGRMQTREAKIILGAAVIDDVLGLFILSVVGGLVVAAETGSGGMDAGSFALILAKSIGFLIAAIGLGVLVTPRLMSFFATLHTHGIAIIASVLLCFTFAYVANLAGLAPIIGAFAAGLILEEVHFKNFRETTHLHDLVRPVTTLLVPVFFVVMGLRVRLETFSDTGIIAIALALTVAAFIGKQLCGVVVPEKGLNRTAIGLGMVPRGEVGLIFASVGIGLQVVDQAIFSAIVIMVILTTFVTPPLLKLSLERQKRNVQKETTS
jgi:Kef-type K+ transport system membrane component KefB